LWNNGWTLLHIASQNGHFDLVQLCVNAGIAIRIWNVTRKIPLSLVLGEDTGSHMLSYRAKCEKVRSFVSKAGIDAILEQVPGDGGDTHLSPSGIK
jgi:ankyrin repeat protein